MQEFGSTSYEKLLLSYPQRILVFRQNLCKKKLNKTVISGWFLNLNSLLISELSYTYTNCL